MKKALRYLLILIRMYIVWTVFCGIFYFTFLIQCNKLIAKGYENLDQNYQLETQKIGADENSTKSKYIDKEISQNKFMGNEIDHELKEKNIKLNFWYKLVFLNLTK
jgi:hypothetical protein